MPDELDDFLGKIKTVQTISLKPGDIVVFTVEASMTAQHMVELSVQLEKYVQDKFPENEILVLTDQVTISKISKEEAEDRSTID